MGLEGFYLGEFDRARAEGVGARRPGAVGGVAHQAVEEGPHGAEDLGRRSVGWLFQGHVGSLCVFCWRGGCWLVTCGAVCEG